MKKKYLTIFCFDAKYFWQLRPYPSFNFSKYPYLNCNHHHSRAFDLKQGNKLWSFAFLSYTLFQRTLLVEMRTLVAWLKSTLKSTFLLKIKCFYIHIYLKTDCLQTNKTQHYLGKENAWEAGGVGERVGINLNFYLLEIEKTGALVKDRSK